MTISIGSELYTAVTKWLPRTDADVTDRIGEFIALSEAVFNRTLRVRQMYTSTTLALSTNGGATLPTDYLEWKAVEYDGSQKTNLEYVAKPWMTETFPTSPPGTPSVFTIQGESLQVMPAATSCVTFRYVQKLTAVSTGTSTSNTNWLLTRHPDAYLFGALTEACGYLIEPEKAAMWKARRDEVLNEIIRLDQKTKSPGSLRVQGYYTP